MKNMSVLTAAKKDQLVYWNEKSRHGMFTHHLLDALYGKGDADGDYRGFSLDLPVIYGEMPPGSTVRRGRPLQAAGCGAPPPLAYRLR